MDLNNKDDVIKIINGCKNNDREYQHLLYKLTFQAMFKICLRYSQDRDEAKDLLQESFLKIYAKISDYNFEGSFEGWLKRIVINNAITYLKKKEKYVEKEYVINNLTDDTEDADEVLETLNKQNMQAENLLELLHELPPAFRSVFNLYYLEDFSHKEIAQKLNISEGSSKSNLHRAKMILKNSYLTKYGNYHEKTE